ncbi:GtrA family protein [Ancylobacter vacuolatus]|uniref:Flippase GtrA n=1 Tax=Ancylobacter vacuolatus TaxID=223389 RepID=A0ABU0DME8_9HYPH|nr:GtrA family protein [Ancylobacter vacuolatus]MDQ0349587.1 putative flippase GtrA [Ancylobacter vacuolatus]
MNEAAMRWAALAARGRHILLFAALGSVGTLAQYAVLIALVQGGLAGPVAGSCAGFVVGGLVNYQLGRRLVFRSSTPHREALAKFFTVAGVGLGLNALLMVLLTGPLGAPYLPAQILVTGLLVLWHYAGNALWTFRAARPGETPKQG